MAEGGFNFFKGLHKVEKEVSDTLDAASEILTEKTDLSKKMEMDRRGFLKAMGKTAIVAGAATLAGEHIIESLVPEKKETVRAIEKFKSLPDKGELFLKNVEAFQKIYSELTDTQAQFIDDDGLLIGKPIAIAPYKGIEPWEVDEHNVLTGQLDQKWLDAHRADVCAAHPETVCDIKKGEPKVSTVVALIQDANKREPNMKAHTLEDVVRFNGAKHVLGVPDKISRIEYLKEHAADRTSFSPLMTHEISSLLPAIAALESKYDNASDSGKAKSILQFTDDTWHGLNYTPEDRLYLKKQAEGASRLLQQKESYLARTVAHELSHIEKEFFSSRDEFEKYFLVPVLINSYNSGEARVANVIRWFVQTFHTRDDLKKELGTHEDDLGYDVYTVMARKARKTSAVDKYADDSSKYFFRVKAWQRILGT